MSKYIPSAGDIVWLNFDPKAGHEQSGLRPAVVLSPASYNGKVGLAILCPITNKQKGCPFEVVIPIGLPIKGVILADQIKSLDWQVRGVKFIAKLPLDVFEDVLAKISAILNFFQSS